MEVAGKVALITGGGSGLGLATAKALSGIGAKVVIADLPSSRGEEAAGAMGSQVVFAPTDVTDEGDVQSAVEVAAGLGGLHIVVNCAGVATPGRVLSRKGPLPLAQFTTVVTINLIGTFNVIRLAAELMVRADVVDGERGVIVNTASVAAFDGQIGQAAYSASKGGVAGMTLPLARDLADKQIRVCTIAPGTFETPMLAGLPEEARKSLGAQVPHPNRLGRPSEYAALVGHIVANPMLNGEVIRLDGALRMAPR
ncbi:MAG: 3-hydroxyacyl-CoA dehydrogenase [Euzebyaceae bacterium]|jgi:NAD(P)-dependent dehydrogenase (short-subunit alcohol dehydrogenase family)|nr:3-hydroxyacyl-CoA dehydrogenase [Euzebyaceae bacterium]MDQ3708152.1 3-hydroxyacyl-CoA dehydrogenase [Actinomycetota bacterium]